MHTFDTRKATSRRPLSCRRPAKAALMFGSLVVLCLGSTQAWAFDKAGVTARADATLVELETKRLPDSAATLARLDEMIVLGSVGVKEFAAKQPQFAKLMDAVVADAPNMKGYTDAEIEDKWGEKGTAGDAVGVPLKSLAQFGPERAYLELIVGPAHAYILNKKWETAQKARWLDQAKDEVTEYKEHLKLAE